MTSWGSAGGVTVLRECSSAFLTQKKFEKQYCVGPTYTNFFRNRASVRRFSSNFFLEALEAFLKNFNVQGGSGYDQA